MASFMIVTKAFRAPYGGSCPSCAQCIKLENVANRHVYTHTSTMQYSPASVGLAQARPNYRTEICRFCFLLYHRKLLNDVAYKLPLCLLITTRTNWVGEYNTKCMLVWDLWFTITTLVFRSCLWSWVVIDHKP